jgi:hypothetical protein
MPPASRAESVGCQFGSQTDMGLNLLWQLCQHEARAPSAALPINARMFCDRTVKAQIPLGTRIRITAVRQRNDRAAAGTPRWLEFRRILEDFKIVLVRSVIDVHFREAIIATFLAVLPVAGMSLLEMVATQRVTPVIAGATVARVREKHVAILIIANPLAATFGPGEILRRTTQAATRHSRGKHLLPSR